MGSEGLAPHFRNLGTRWSWVVNFTIRPLDPRYPFHGRLGGPQSLSEHSGEEKEIPAPTTNRSPVV